MQPQGMVCSSRVCIRRRVAWRSLSRRELPLALRNVRNATCVIVRNPFEYGGVVSGDAFCNRTKELSDLVRATQNGEKLFVFSERRYGKTSLVRAALRKLPRKNFVSAYVDLWPTDSEATFVAAVARSIAESLSSSAGK